MCDIYIFTPFQFFYIQHDDGPLRPKYVAHWLLHTITVFHRGFYYLPTIKSSSARVFLLSFFRIPMQKSCLNVHTNY